MAPPTAYVSQDEVPAVQAFNEVTRRMRYRGTEQPHWSTGTPRGGIPAVDQLLWPRHGIGYRSRQSAIHHGTTAFWYGKIQRTHNVRYIVLIHCGFGWIMGSGDKEAFNVPNAWYSVVEGDQAYVARLRSGRRRPARRWGGGERPKTCIFNSTMIRRSDK